MATRQRKFDRARYFNIVSLDGRDQLDLLSFEWLRFNKFLVDRNLETYVVSSDRDGRLDLISNDFYGTVDLWWIIAIANSILDVMSEIVVGKRLSIPSLSDVEEFYQLILRNQRQLVEVAFPSRSI